MANVMCSHFSMQEEDPPNHFVHFKSTCNIIVQLKHTPHNNIAHTQAKILISREEKKH